MQVTLRKYFRSVIAALPFFALFKHTATHDTQYKRFPRETNSDPAKKKSYIDERALKLIT